MTQDKEMTGRLFHYLPKSQGKHLISWMRYHLVLFSWPRVLFVLHVQYCKNLFCAFPDRVFVQILYVFVFLLLETPCQHTGWTLPKSIKKIQTISYHNLYLLTLIPSLNSCLSLSTGLKHWRMPALLIIWALLVYLFLWVSRTKECAERIWTDLCLFWKMCFLPLKNQK